ncbi:MAG: 4-(cytidine 5'-diphospho)-2-C-methyl-D-erythritol kinase [Brachybacterium sp.]|nr:4-(cytidine 5'-diphospho)-2-C-methyl-D-erythritol kinase [Brachybacterium sp.]
MTAHPSPPRRRVTVRAPGKINLSLAVGAVDARGYHELATVFHAVGLYETVTVERAVGLHLHIDSRVPGDVPTDGTNLALRAAELLRSRFTIAEGAAIRIVKDVPVAGGMGGGSADAAATLVALERLWGLGLTADELRRLGAELGADVPFAMLGHTALGRGNGAEVTSVLTTGEYRWVLAVPGGHLSTPEVFARFDALVLQHGREVPAVPEPDHAQLAALRTGDIRQLGATLHNDLEAPACSLHPGLAPVLRAAADSGCPGALVSGSGPTIAVLTEDRDHAERVRRDLDATGLLTQTLDAEGSVPGARIIDED